MVAACRLDKLINGSAADLHLPVPRIDAMLAAQRCSLPKTGAQFTVMHCSNEHTAAPSLSIAASMKEKCKYPCPTIINQLEQQLHTCQLRPDVTGHPDAHTAISICPRHQKVSIEALCGIVQRFPVAAVNILVCAAPGWSLHTCSTRALNAHYGCRPCLLWQPA